MPFFALPNLISTQVTPVEAPWIFSADVPPEVRGKEGKKARDKWISDQTTKHQCYSAFEGVNAFQRVAESKGAQEGNPPLKIHAFVADIDAQVSEDELAAGIARLGEFVPNYLERTLSGNARLIWLFEKPVLVPNTRFAVEFLKYALVHGRFEQVAAALDKPAWETPNRYYTNSGEWRQIDPDRRIPHALLQGWVVEVAEKHAWKKDRGSLEIPLPIVWTELQKKYPTAASWPGDFAEAAQGPSFWIPGSESPKSAIVKTTGLYTFAAHAHKPFFSWADLLGKDFVDRYAAEQLGKAVEDIYHDGRIYYRKDGHQNWKGFSKEDIMLHLATDRGLSTVKDGGMPSEINRAISYIQNWHGVEGAAPFAYQKTGIIKVNGKSFLNTHTRRVLTPAQEPAVWGPDGNFPFLSKFFDGFFHPQSKPGNPLQFWLAWLARTYVSAYELCLESGQNVIIMGPPGVGKSFLNQFVLPMLMGGAAEAQAFMLGQTAFNSQLFEYAIWTIDDNSVTLDARSLRHWGSTLKKMAANQVHEFNEKYRSACQVEWRGRVCVTANADEHSASIVPDLSISIMDKLSLYRTADQPPVVFPPRKELVKLVMAELPYFARFLLDYVAPEYTQGTARFGTKAYHDESIVRVADHSSSTASFAEILDEWRRGWFGDHPGEKSWVGNSTKLLMAMHSNEALAQSALRGATPREILRQLGSLAAKGLPWLRSEDAIGAHGESSRNWVVLRPELPPFTSSISSKI